MCDTGDLTAIRARVEALEAKLQAFLDDGNSGGPALPGVSVFPKGLL